MRRSVSQWRGLTLALWIAAALAGVALTLAPAQLLAQATATVSVGGNDELGDFLVAENGMTLYYRTSDEPGTSSCTGRCEEAWPTLTVAEGIEPSAGAGVSGTLGVHVRANGSRQVTYNDAPLHFWFRDSASGDATGQAVAGQWYVMSTATGFATALTVANQPFEPDTTRFVVPDAALDQPFYVVVHQGDAESFGAVIGSTGLFQPGKYTEVRVVIDRPLVAGEYVWPMLHTEDNGNGVYDDPGTDKPVVHAAAGNGSFGGVVVFRSQITQDVATVLTVADQAFASGTTQLAVPAAAFDQPFYIVVHQGDADSFGAVIGNTDLFQPGAYTNVAVSLDRPLVAGEYVWPMLHTEDNGNGVYDDPGTDKPIVHAAAGNGSFGGVVVFRSQIAQLAAPSSGNAGLLTGGGGATAAAMLFGVSVVIALLLGGRALTARRREL